MEERHDDRRCEENSPNAAWWSSDFINDFSSISLASQEDDLSIRSLNRKTEQDLLPHHRASDTIWSTGMLLTSIPNGFYSLIPYKRLKEFFVHVPTMEELHKLASEGVIADVIIVDSEKDKKITMLKQFIVTSVRGMNSNPAAMIKKIASLVSEFYKRSNPDSSPAKALAEENAQENKYFHLLGQIKNGSCRPRAILFKVLADAVGLESKLVVGLPNDGDDVGCIESYRHMSVVVVLNSVELLVDLMRFPGQLIPCSTKAIFMTHICGAGESDSAENDSCDSPLEPNSPLYEFSEKADLDSPSQSEPSFASPLWRRSRRKVIAEQRTASSSPEHPSPRARGRSLLGGDKKFLRNHTHDIATSSCRSDGATTFDARRVRRRSISITPEIGDDIVRAVRAMNETLKQNRLSKVQTNDGSLLCSLTAGPRDCDTEENGSKYAVCHHDEISGARSASCNHREKQKATSLPSSPHDFGCQESKGTGNSEFGLSDEMVSTWNKVLESLLFYDKPLLPFPEWHIDFSELTVGTRVGIGFFGEVFRGIWNGTEVAIKVFLEQDLTAENMEDFCNEISILSRLRHPNVILFVGACTKPPRLSMITEYMEMGSLYSLIHLNAHIKRLSWRRRLKMLRDICRGLLCIHRMKVAHRDLKTANCLVNKHWTVKICDFGLSRFLTIPPSTDTSSVGTPEWMAPELIRNEPFTEKCDIFSLGVIMWELSTLCRPWEGVPTERVVYAIAHEGSRLEIPEGPLGGLISDCWGEPEQRPGCEEILRRLLDCEYSPC